jgi:hypothetical protein
MYVGDISDYFSLSSNYGVHVNVHNKTISPSYFQGIDVDVGKETSIVVTKQLSYRLPPPYGKCTEDLAAFNSTLVNIFTKNNRYYRQRYCYNYCYQRKLVEVNTL